MPDTEFNCLATVIGSMPQDDAEAACTQVVKHLRDIPAWPQLPKRSPLENMYVQFSQGFPGLVVDGDRLEVHRSSDFEKQLEAFYTDFLADDFYKYAVSADYAAGLHAFLNRPGLSPLAVKGQVTGPVTWGLMVTDEDGKAIVYDDTLRDVVPKFLKMKASWMEKALGQISKRTIVFLDEPYMTAFGSVGMMLSREDVIGLLNETFTGIEGVKGVHCCGNTDWSILLATTSDIISFDTYNFAESLTLYPTEVKAFLARNGAIAWGIVPNEEEALKKESVASLKDRLEEAMAPFTRVGIPFERLVKQGLITPSCSLASFGTTDAADCALELLADLSTKFRQEYL